MQVFNSSPLFLAIGLAMGLASTSAFAQTYTDVAQVISATPIYERVPGASRQECWTETISSDRRTPSSGYVETYNPSWQTGADRSIGGGTVLGAILGGIAGYQFGNSQRGQNTGAAVGAVLGGLIGNSIENSMSTSAYQGPSGHRSGRVDYLPETRTVERCRPVPDAAREQIVGYHVTYRYAGRDYQTRMSYDPGPNLNVRVTLAPETRR